MPVAETEMPVADPNDSSLSYIPHFAKGALINFSGGLARMALLYIYTLLLARMLPASALGEYFMMFSIINILGLASVVGLDFGLIRYVSLFATEGDFTSARRVLKSSLIIGTLIGIVAAAGLFYATPILKETFFDNSDTAVTGLRIFAIAVPFLVIARMFNATTQAMHKMQYQVISRDLVEQISKVLLSVVAVAIGAQLLGIVWANVASILIGATLSLFFSTLVLPKRMTSSPAVKIASPSVRRPELRLLKYSFPLAFSNLLALMLLWIDTLLLGYLSNSTNVGFYGAALRVATASAAVTVAFTTVFAPVIPELYNRGRMEQLSVLFKTVSKWIFICSFPIFLILALFSEPIMRLFGSDFSSGSLALVLLAFGQLLSATAGPTGFMILMSGRSRIELFNMAASLSICVILCFILISKFGIVGAALANMFAAGSLVLLRSAEVWYFMRIKAFDRSYIKPLIAGFVATGAISLIVHLMNTQIGLVKAIIFSIGMLIIYLLAIRALGLDEHDEIVLGLLKARVMRARQSAS